MDPSACPCARSKREAKEEKKKNLKSAHTNNMRMVVVNEMEKEALHKEENVVDSSAG